MTATGEQISTESLSFEELGAANRTRCEASFHAVNDWSPTDWACAAAGELGEMCNLIKKLRRLEMGGGSEFASRQQGYDSPEAIIPLIADEIADTVIYLDLLAQRLSIDMASAIRRKFNVVSERVDSEIRL